MDTRTREKYRAQVRVMLHLLEGHRSRLPAGKPLNTAWPTAWPLLRRWALTC